MTTASLSSGEVRDPLVRALGHDAVEDAVTELLFEHVRRRPRRGDRRLPGGPAIGISAAAVVFGAGLRLLLWRFDRRH